MSVAEARSCSLSHIGEILGHALAVFLGHISRLKISALASVVT